MELNPESKADSVRLHPSCIKRRTFFSRTVERYFEKLILNEEEKYLETAKKVADFFLSEAEKIDYKIKCDFRQPAEPELYDSSAAALAACGMIEIYKETKDEKYLNGAIKLVEACDKYFCPWDDENDEALMNFGCAMHRDPKHQSLIYGDFYFFRAVCELSKILEEKA